MCRQRAAVGSLHNRLAVDVGTTLRTARELRGLQVAQLAARTKIPVGILRAIEDNEFDKVPSGIFVRGFIRAYAREVGLDATEMVEQFLPVRADVPSEGNTEAPLAASAPIKPSHIDPEGSGWRLDLGYAVIVPALVVCLVSFNPGGTSEGTPSTPAAAPPPTPPPVAEAAPVAAGAAATGPEALTP